MQSHRVVYGLLVAGLLAGCQSKPKAPPLPPPATLETVRTVQEDYQRIDPKAEVGLVVDVLPDANLAAVNNLPVDQFKEGDVLVFIDSQGKTIAKGKVRSISGDTLAIKYIIDQPGQRPPRKGDMAVYVH